MEKYFTWKIYYFVKTMEFLSFNLLCNIYLLMYFYLFQAKRSLSFIWTYTQYLFTLTLWHLFARICIWSVVCVFFFHSSIVALKIDMTLSICGYISSNASFWIFRLHVNGMNPIMMMARYKTDIQHRQHRLWSHYINIIYLTHIKQKMF